MSVIRRLLPAGLVLLAVGLAIAWPRDRVFHLNASTDYLSLEFDDSPQNAWSLSGFAVCGDAPRAEFLSDGAVEEACGKLDLAPVTKLDAESMLTIHPGALAVLFWSAPAGLVIELYPPAGQNVVGTVITPAEELGQPVDGEAVLVGIGRPAALHTFAAKATLGTSARPGVESILRSGNASVYETGLFGARRLKVDETELTAGDVVSIENGAGNLVPMSGFLVLPNAAAPGDTGSSIEVVAYAGTSQSSNMRSPERARITRFGTGGYEFKPTMLMRIINEPWILAFGILMGVVGSLLENYGKFAGLFERDSKPGKEE